jgi:L-ascorbate metabolism protein UlaG (beta-lactamase superfamily)
MCVACAFASVGPALGGAPALAVFPAVPDPWPLTPVGVTLTWTGVAGFVFEADGVRIAIDPFVSRPGLFATLFRRARSDAVAVERRFAPLDAVFVGHTHFDHALDLESIAARFPGCRFFGSRTTVELCCRRGIDAARLTTVSDGSAASIGPFRVQTIAAAHGLVPLVRFVDRVELPPEGMPRTPFRWPRGDVFAYRVEALGRSFHVQGSAGLDEPALARQAPCDVLIACLAARRGTPRYLDRLGDRLRPQVLLPCHHDDFFRPLTEAPRPIATLRWSAFLEEAAALAASHGTTLVRPSRFVPTDA